MTPIMNKKERMEIIKKFNLNPDIQVKPLYVLNVPVVFLGFTKKGLEMWKSQDGKILYIMY